jgi:hypothetical protein
MRDHEDGTVNIEPYLNEAMESLVDDLFGGEKVGFGKLQDYLEVMEDKGYLSEIVATTLHEHDSLRNRIEGELRRMLDDSDALMDRATELASSGPEES